MIQKILKNHIFWIIIFIAALWQGKYLFNSGFYTFSDESHIANLHQMVQALKSGQFPPRWAPNFSYNFGHPFFIFYYLLPSYFGSFLNIFLGLSLIWSLKITFFISTLGSGLAMYFLSRQFFTKTVSTAVALIYLFTPYRAVDLYARGAVGELFGFLFMPLVFLSFILLIKNKDKKYFAFAVFSLFFLIISHQLTLIIFFPFLLFLSITYIYFYYPPQKAKFPFLRIFWAILLSFCLATYYLIPAIFEKKYMQGGTPFNPIDHFPFIKQLIIPYWGYGASVWGPTDQLSFNIGIANLIGVILIIPFAIFSRNIKYKSVIVSLLLCFSIAVFMMNIRSWPLWQIVPIASYIQFPWRFLILTTFTTPLLIGFLSLKKNFSWLPIVLAVVATISTANYFRPHKILNVDDNYFLNRFFINQNTQRDPSLISSEYQLNSEDYLPLTNWTIKRPTSLLSKIDVAPEVTVSNIKYLSEISLSFTAKSAAPTIIKISNYYYPGWQAKIDGQITPVFPVDDTGRIGINMSAGEHQVFLEFKNTPLRTIADAISLLTIVFFAIYLVYEKHS
ncbi:MAG: hypothetical protein WC841_01540 [Candidatus Shapirobacteria bacterium]|jgi:hypothetical protein